jgi:hypothetical protein
MDSRADYYKSVFDHQVGNGYDFPIYQGRMQYGHGFNVFQGRHHYGAGLGDVIRGIWRFFRPVAMSGAKTLLKAGSEAIKDGATIKDVLSQTLKPTVGTMLSATAEQVANRLAADQPAAAPPPGPPNTYTVPQTGSGTRKRKTLYKSAKIKHKRISSKNSQRPIIYNF